MKKFFFATLMFLGVVVVSDANTSAKTTTYKIPTSTVNPVSLATKTATDNTAKKHKKHKKHHKAPKK